MEGLTTSWGLQAEIAESFPMAQKYIMQVVRKLRDSVDQQEMTDAARTLGDLGHGYDAVPALSEALHRAHKEGNRELMDVATEVLQAPERKGRR